MKIKHIKRKVLPLFIYWFILSWQLWIHYVVPFSGKTADITNVITVLFVGYGCIKFIYNKVHMNFAVSVVSFCIIVVTSALAAKLLFNQSIFDGIICLRSTYMPLLIYFPLTILIKKNIISKDDILRITLHVITLACILYCLHFIIYEATGRLILNLEPSEWGRYGTARFYFVLIMPIFLMFNNYNDMLKAKRWTIKMWKNLYGILLVMFLMVFVCKMRMTTCAALVSMVLGLIIAKRMSYRKVVYIIAGCVLAILFLQTNMGVDIVNSIMNKESISSIREYGRSLHIQSFLSNPIFGCGYPHENCYASAAAFGVYDLVYVGDNGIFDFMYIFGGVGLIWIGLTFLNIFKKAIQITKQENNYTYLMFAVFLVVSMYTELNWFFGGMLFFGIYLVLLETKK